ncbi:DDB1- and CUL4-associated factor 15-like [Haliotis rufescens]|uniref:DDB1- and CUL4-associated factor 15-like n=1 Tax=Haliotis rufescens TaxID=6454 RepID=UPI001EAF9703|nr:DDB1- and CUL4-associated factor 15-like [Haliotis rufescens]
MAASLVHKLAVREQTGKLKVKKKSLSWKPFTKIPGRLCYRLKSLVPQFVLEEGHVFLGFTKSGQFVLSYSLHVDADEHTAYPVYVYRLHWWRFVPERPLELVSEVRLFGEEDIVQDLFLAFCEWPEDDTKVLVYGHCVPGRGDDSCQCYLTVTAVPSLKRCQECRLLKKESSGNPGTCLQHSFCLHTKYELAPPFPAFSPRVQLKIDGIAILNTGDSIVALQVDATHSPSSFNQTDDTLLGETTSNTEHMQSDLHDNSYIGAELSILETRTSIFTIEDSNSPLCHDHTGGIGRVNEFLEGMQEITADDDEENVHSPELEGSDLECSECKSTKNCEHCRHIPKETRHGPSYRPALKAKNCTGESNSQHSDCMKPMGACGKLTCPVGSPGNQCSHSYSPFTDTKCHSPEQPMRAGCSSANLHDLDDIVNNCSTSKLSSQRSFFSPSNSGASTTGSSKSSESVVVHTNHSRTVTFSLRKYGYTTEDSSESPLPAEDDYDLAYRSVLPVEVLWCDSKQLSIIRSMMPENPAVTVLQMTFDIEHYMVEVIHQEAEWGPRYVAFCNYDLQILDVCPDSFRVFGTVHALIQARDRLTKQSKGAVKSYQTSFTFEWNLRTGNYSTLHIDELTEMNEQIMRGKEWKPGSKECGQLRRKSYCPQSFYRSVHILSNEAVFKGRSLPMLIAPYQYTAILL